MIRLALAALALACGLGAARADEAPNKPFGIVKRFSGPDGGWDFLAVDSAARRLYVARSYGVLSVDLASGGVTDKLVAGNGVHGVLPLPDSGLVVSSNGKSNNVLLFDGATGKIEATIASGASPDAMVFEPKSGLVIIFNGKSSDATLLDPRTRTIVATIGLEGKPEVAVADGTGQVFVNLEDKAQIAVLDIAARAVKSRFDLPGCEAPTGLALDGQSSLLVSACANQVAKVLDAATGKDLATLTICAGPDGALLDARRRRLFIPCADGQMSLISFVGREARALSTITTGGGAKTGAVDAATGRVYLGAAQFAAPEKAGAKPKALPGTFEILVLSDEN